MVNIKTYNPIDCVVTIKSGNNSFYVTGLGEDMVSAEKDEDNVSAVVGAQGDVVVNKINNSLGTITLTVQGTSPQKKSLLELANSGSMFEIWVNNKSIGENVGGTKAMIKKTPALEQGTELADREFEIQVFDYTVGIS